jgi:hypothetical protein
MTRPRRRLRAANDNRLTWRERLRQVLPLLGTAAVLAAALWMMAQ